MPRENHPRLKFFLRAEDNEGKKCTHGNTGAGFLNDSIKSPTSKYKTSGLILNRDIASSSDFV